MRRYAKLVKLQEQIKQVEQTRQAAHLAAARRIDEDCREVMDIVEEGSLAATLFPDLCARHIGTLVEQRRQSEVAAKESEARAHKEGRRLEKLQDKASALAAEAARKDDLEAALDAIERRHGKRGPASRKIGSVG